MLELRDAKGTTVVVPVEINATGQHGAILNLARSVYFKEQLAHWRACERLVCQAESKGKFAVCRSRKNKPLEVVRRVYFPLGPLQWSREDCNNAGGILSTFAVS